ncbi:class I SAM-dependent methyltransferase [Kalamiella sp. sgz302252]|uniref:class I SAM-dependent methyltransferase n=1 Tax=Pantoea sp. sgz302252 TaxID=3341827 RepID=UPI0036D2A621
MLIDGIDFALLYKEQLRQAKRTEKSPQHWDRRASKMAESCGRSASRYLRELLSHMDLTGASTLLDIGCGPGTVCLAVADRLDKVYGLDYSTGMLEVAAQRAAAQGVDNAVWLPRAWEDSWEDLPVCDIAVASRSTLVGDLRQALAKLNRQARLRVYTTHTVSGTFVDPELLRAIDRPVEQLPNYIYAVNILYQMGIHARVDFIEDDRCQKAQTFEDALQAVSRATGELNASEQQRLAEYCQQRKAPAAGKKWALVYWDCQPETGR